MFIRNPIQEIDLKMCRICNASKGEISIFDNLAHPNISEDIKHFSGVSVSIYTSAILMLYLLISKSILKLLIYNNNFF